MKTNKTVFTLSGLLLTALLVTGCSSNSYTHTRSFENAVYSADINHNGTIDENEKKLTWAQSYDVLMKQAGSIKELNKYINPLKIDSNDTKRISLARYEILHEAEELLMSTGTLVPLYNYGNSFLVKPNTAGLISCNLGYKMLYEMYDKNTNKALDNVTTCFGTKAETFDSAANVDSSTANVIAQFMIGAKRYARGPEIEPGIFDTVVEDGICTTKKRLVTSDPSLPTSNPETYISISECPDIMEEVDLFTGDASKQEEIKKSYELTARYTITLKNGAVWNDGSPVEVEDFEYGWNRTSSGVYNGQGFGTWCTVFDMIRGFYVWNAVGQQTSANYDDWKPLAKKNFDELVANEENPEDAKKIFLHQYEQVFNGITKDTNVFKTTRKCKGGMAGFMAGVAMNTSNANAAVTHVADNKSFTVQLSNDCDYFEDLLAFNALLPVDKSVVIKDPDNPNIEPSDETQLNKICAEDPTWWLNGNGKFHSTGPLQLDGPIDNIAGGGAVLKTAEHVTPGVFTNDIVKRMECKFIDRQDTIYQEYKKADGFTMVDRIPPALLESLMQTPDYHSTEKIGSFYYGFNVNDNVFDTRPDVSEREREKMRKILTNLINRRDITENLARGGSLPCNGYVSRGITERAIPVWDSGKGAWVHKTETKGSKTKIVTADWHDRNLDTYSDFLTDNDYSNKIMGNRDEGGFIPVSEELIDRNDPTYVAEIKQIEEKEMKLLADDAIRLAKEVGINYNERTGKFTNFPKITIVTNSGTDLEDLAERIQAYYGLWGIDASIQTQEWQSFLATRRMGDFSYCRQGWIADYNDPKTYLDLYRSNDGNNDSQLGKDNWHRSR